MIRTVNILLVEDNEIDRECIDRAFQRNRIANPLTHARDGVEGLEILRGAGGRPRLGRPSLILLDINMPRMNGVEFLRELRADPDLRDSVVFVLTTSKDDEDRVAAYQLNVAGYMVKSEVGSGFIRLVELLECYWRVVAFP